jgi:hypothetical protein
MRILVVSLELVTAPFSGNGVLAAAQAGALAAAGHTVCVLSAAPAGAARGEPPALCRAVEVGVPREAWGRLDASGPWREFASGAADAATTIAAAPPDIVLAVDWTGWLAAAALKAARPDAFAQVPVLFAAFRVHSRTDGAAAVMDAETGAMRGAAAAAALCAADAGALAALAPGRAAVAVLIPPLRAAIRDLPPPDAPQRTLLTCCVRLSPEKEPHRFVALVEAAAATGAFAGLGIRPALVGAGRDPYAASLRARLLDAWPGALVIPDFLDPPALAARVLDRTLLNVHPSLEDAFGMTVVEAGARGAPTALHGVCGGGEGVAGAPPRSSIGAAALLRPGAGEAFAVDLSASPAAAAAAIASLLSDRARLASAGAAAAARVRAHDERAHGAELGRLLEACVGSGV